MKVAVFLNGECEDFLCIPFDNYDLLVAVDGGVRHFLRAGLVPDVFVGDGDSVDESDLRKLSGSNCEVLVFPREKDEIDAELALRKAVERGASEIDVFCWMGERLDMLFALIYLMGTFDARITAKSDKLIVGVTSGEMELDAEPGEKWSILPIGGDAHGVTLSGFKYEIRQRDMPWRSPYGVSNVAVSRRVKVTVESGKVAYFRWLKEPS